MQVAENILLQPEDFLRLKQIKAQRKTLRQLAGAAAFATGVWALIFSVLAWTVADYGYSWSPLKWLAPIGAIIASSGVIIGWRMRKLRAEKEQLRSRTSMFVLNKGDLNDFKSKLHTLANKALSLCDTHQQAHEVLVAYRAAAMELIELDVSLADTTQNETLEGFEGRCNELRRVHDEVDGKRALRRM